MIGRSASGDPNRTASDRELVKRCISGDEQAWASLLERYKRLMFSIPLKYGLSAEDAADIFQALSVDLVTELPRLRRPDALKAWLASAARHRALRWKARARRSKPWEEAGPLEAQLPDPTGTAASVMEEIEREQTVRDSVRVLPDRCRELVRLLFFEQPPLPYAEVARRLGLAVGSIGFIRGRCLEKLRAELKTRGFS